MLSTPFNVKSGALLPVLRTWGDEAVLTMPNMKFLDIIYIYTNSRPSTGMIKIILSRNNNINRLLRKA
jgi:hypothetical protein